MAVERLLAISSFLATRYSRRFQYREELLVWQDRQVSRFVERIRSASRFYARLWSGIPSSDWRRFPIIDKQTMMASFDELNTVNVRKADAFRVALAAEESRDFSETLGGVTVGLSSGTSGHRGLFLVSARERAEWAGVMLARVLPSISSERVAFFLRSGSQLYSTLRSRWLDFQYFDLLDSLEIHRARLEALRPTILVAPPSMLRILGHEREAGRLAIEPARVISVAEVLDPLDRRHIARAFGRRIDQVYQCTEGFLGVSCEYETVHLNEDLVAVEREWLDESRRRFVPIITDFRRFAQPIVRYRLNDILTERAEPCPCGRVLLGLEQIEGRADDLFWLRSRRGDGWIPLFPDFVRRVVLEVSDAIETYFVRQVSPERIEVFVDVAPERRGDVEDGLRASFRKLFDALECRPTTVVLVEGRERPRLQKLRRVERAFELEDVRSPSRGEGRKTDVRAASTSAIIWAQTA